MKQFKQLLNVFINSWFWLFLLLLLLDQVSKHLAHNLLEFGTPVTLIPSFLFLNLQYNTGAAWSILDGNLPILAIISAVVGIGLFVYFFKEQKKLGPIKKALLAVILAGTWGNFIDRAFNTLLIGRAGVIDFISFQFGTYYFPVFNVADICLTLGIIIFAIYLSYEDHKHAKQNKEKETSSDDENV